MQPENPTAEQSVNPESINTPILPSPSALFIEGSKIATQETISFHKTIARLGLDPTNFQKPIQKIEFIDSLPNNRKVKLAIFMTANSLLTDPSPESKQKGIDIITAEPELRNDIIASNKKEGSQELADLKDQTFIRSYGGKVLEKRVRDGKVSLSQAVHLALAFQSLGQELSAAEKASIINAVLNPSWPLPPHLEDARLKIGSTSRTYESIYQSVLKTLPIRDQRSGRMAHSSFAGAAQRTLAAINLCTDDDRILQSFRAEKSTGVPHEINKLTDIVDIVRNNPEINTVSFDLYDTLVQWTSNQGERRGQMNALATHLLNNKYGFPITLERFRDAAENAWAKRWKDYQSQGIEVDIQDTLAWILDDIGGVADPQQRLQALADLENLWYKVELDTSARIPEAEITLKTLKEMGKKICLTSNASWSEEHIRRVLKRFGLEQYFDTISTSLEHGKMKHPAMADFFHHSWAKAGAAPEQVLHVGDNPYADFEGARFAGANAAQYINPDSFVEIETNPYYWENPSEYSKKAYEFFRRSQNREALTSIDTLLEERNIPPEERERVRKMAREVYQKSRDIMGPAYTALGDVLLSKLSSGESDLVLCLARDGLPLAVAQKLLLYLEPDQYPNAKPDQVRYVHASRKLLDQSESDETFRNNYLAFLSKHGINHANKIILTDLLCASGRTHEGIKQLLPGKQVSGYYIDTHTGNRLPEAHSFLKESLDNPDAWLVAENMLLLMETLYSGPLQSSRGLKDTSSGLAADVRKKSIPEDVLDRGLSEQSLLLFNHLAILGIQDAVADLHRRRLLKMEDPTDKEVMARYNAFISSPPSEVWQDIWRSIPWQDNGRWHRPLDAEKDGAVRLGKI